MSKSTITFDPKNIPDCTIAEISAIQPPNYLADKTSSFQTIVAESQHVIEKNLKMDRSEVDHLEDISAEYDVMEKFAEGGQGTLFTAQDRFLKRYVVVKSLKDEFQNETQIVNNFLTEARITAQLDHNSIVPLYSINKDKSEGLHMAMKLINGRTLTEILKELEIDYKKYGVDNHKEHRNLHTRLDYFVKVCDAISYAHNKGIVHRDLKPDNIMVSEFNEVYVMDWGIAQTFSDAENTKNDKNIKRVVSGTPGFIAPEVLREGEPNPASDQFSLGIILYELVSFIPALTGNTVIEISEKTVRGRFNQLLHRFPGIAIEEDMRAIIAKSLSLDPKDRYSSVNELAKDVRNYIQDEETLARPDNLPRKAGRWIINHRLITGTIILAILLAFASLAIVSLIQQKNTITVSAIRERQLMKFQRNLLLRAQSIDRHFTQMENVLRIFESKSSLFLTNELRNSNAKFFYNYREFREKGNNAPPGTEQSKLYKQKISLEVGNFALAQGLTLENAEKDIQALSPLSGVLLKCLADSSSENLYSKESIEVIREKAMNTGFPIRWIYLGLENGLLLNFPGNGNMPDNYDPRKRPWYENATKTQGVHWSNPYIDAFGQGLIISPSLSIKNDSGKLMGVASMDVTFDYITKKMMSTENNHHAVIAKYLVDQSDNVILCSKLSEMKDKEAEKTFSQVKLKKFPYPVDNIFKGKGNQIETKCDGRNLLISTALIPSLKWYYVEVVDLNWLIRK